MKITIRKKLIIGFTIILLLMSGLSVVTHLSLVRMGRANDIARSLLLKMEAIDELRFTVLRALNINDFIISGDLEKRGYFELLDKLVDESIMRIEGIDLDKDEKVVFDKVKNGFEQVKKRSNEIIKNLNLMGKKRFQDRKMNKLIVESDAASLDVVENIEGLYELIDNKSSEALQEAERVKKTATQATVVISIIAILFCLIISLVLIRNITKPLGYLMEATRKIEGGDLTAQAKVVVQDEIGNFANSFNKMVGSLKTLLEKEKEFLKADARIAAEKKRAEEFMALNQQLEASGQELKATNQQLMANEQELTAANQQLRANEQQLRAANQQLKANEQMLIKIQEELKEKLADLEFYKEVTVGRELKMVDLKKEINALLNEFGRESKYDEIDEME